MFADYQIPLLLATMLVAVVLFSLEKVSAELTALGLLLTLILTGLLPAEEAFAGFGSDVVVMTFGLLILMAALQRTGVTDPVQLLLLVMVTAVVVGGFVSNTAATAFFLPIVFGLARRKGLSPAKFLMPLAFASILASSLTLIGTSTNILVSGFMISYGEEAYGEVNWTVLILIASMLGLGRAMETTGTASFLASQLVNRVGDVHPTWLLSAFFGLTVLLTQPMSNQASAAVVLPVAFNVADQLGLNPRSFGIMIALAASTSFLTPLEPAALLVYGPGHYRFADFPRVGFLLSLLIYLVAILMVPWLWPLR